MGTRNLSLMYEKGPDGNPPSPQKAFLIFPKIPKYFTFLELNPPNLKFIFFKGLRVWMALYLVFTFAQVLPARYLSLQAS